MDIIQMFAEAVDLLWTDLPNLVGKPWYDLESQFINYRHQLLEGSSDAALAQAYIIHELRPMKENNYTFNIIS